MLPMLIVGICFPLNETMKLREEILLLPSHVSQLIPTLPSILLLARFLTP